jgi:hypothetical protein
VQAIEHHYLDRRRDQWSARPKRHLRARVSGRISSK